MHPISKAIRIQTDRTNEMEHSSPMFLTSSFCFDNAEDMRAAFADETDDNIYRQEFYKILDACIEKMPSKLIPVFVSKYIDEKDSEQIRKEFDLTSSNYWVIVHRAKLLIRECLERNWFLK